MWRKGERVSEEKGRENGDRDRKQKVGKRKRGEKGGWGYR